MNIIIEIPGPLQPYNPFVDDESMYRRPPPQEAEEADELD